MNSYRQILQPLFQFQQADGARLNRQVRIDSHASNMAWQKIFQKIYRIMVNMRDSSEFRSNCRPRWTPLTGAQIWRKLVTAGESVRINEQLCWVAGLAEGQGGD